MNVPELCCKCWVKLNKSGRFPSIDPEIIESFKEKDVTLTTQKERCDGCGQYKRIFVSGRKPNIFTPLRLIARKRRIGKRDSRRKKVEKVVTLKWDKIWAEIYDFQSTIPKGCEATEENAKNLGLMTVIGKQGESLFINESLSKKLFAYRVSC